MKKNWLQIVTLCLCAVLLVVVVLQGRQIEEMQFQLEYKLDDLYQSLSNEIYNVSGSLEWALEEAEQVISDYALEPVGIDPEDRALLADVSVTLKEWYEDTEVTLLAQLGEELVTLPMTMGESGAFSCSVSLPLEGNYELYLNAQISGGGLTRQEELGSWGDCSMLLPLRNAGGGWSGPDYQDGVLHCGHFTIYFEGRDGIPAVVQNPEFQFYRNGELVQTLAAINDPHSSSDSGHSYGPDTPDHDWSIECDPGDSIEVRFRCEDEFGLGYDFLFLNVVVQEEGAEEQIIGGAVGDELKLYWPE